MGLAQAGEGLGLGLVIVRQGRVLDERVFHFPHLGPEESAEVLEHFLIQFYHRC